MSYGGFLRNSTGLKSNQCQKPLTLETYHPNYLFKEGELTTKILGTQSQLRSAEYRIKTGALIHHLVNEIIKKIIVKKNFILPFLSSILCLEILSFEVLETISYTWSISKSSINKSSQKAIENCSFFISPNTEGMYIFQIKADVFKLCLAQFFVIFKNRLLN